MIKIQTVNTNYKKIEQFNNQIAFQSNPTSSPTASKSKNEPQKNNFTFKNFTNVLGVLAWIGVVGYSIKSLKLLNSKSPEMVSTNAKNLKKQVLSQIENLSNPEANNVDKIFEGKSSKGLRKLFYNMGNKFQNAKMRVGGEMFNNLLYAFGTLVVMPLVVLFSPFGKKSSTKEDKLATVLRQPLSVAATFGMQFTFDKLIDKNVPEVLKRNTLEDKSILDESGKIKFMDENNKFSLKNYESIKYNTDSAKEGFKLLNNIDVEQGGLKGLLQKEEIENIFKMNSYDDTSSNVYKDKLKDVLNNKYKDLRLKSLDDISKNAESYANFKLKNAQTATDIEKILNHFEKFTNVVNNNTMAVQKSKTIVNVIAASIIGCTFLNVIYGKTIKNLNKHKESKTENITQSIQDKKTKEVK